LRLAHCPPGCHRAPNRTGSQIGDDALDPLIGQGILVPRLGRRKQPQILEALVADERLRELCDAVHHVDKVEYNASFRPHDEVEIAQADVEIDNYDFFPALREGCTERGGGSGFSNAAFT